MQYPRASPGQGFACGANRTDHHLRDVWWDRDLPAPDTADLDLVQEGDVDEAGRLLELRAGIEIGHIFQLGTRYSDALDVGVLDEHGHRRPVWMGSYGTGIPRAAAAIIEQHHDEHGILWPKTVAPYDVVIVQIDVHDTPQTGMAEQAYDELGEAGLQVAWDDRDVRAGVKFQRHRPDRCAPTGRRRTRRRRRQGRAFGPTAPGGARTHASGRARHAGQRHGQLR
ncbi:MAG TPA: hypothetical protein VGA69_10380 [Nitriliruptorales bacterium]